jgi:hypothetical protein
MKNVECISNHGLHQTGSVLQALMQYMGSISMMQRVHSQQVSQTLPLGFLAFDCKSLAMSSGRARAISSIMLQQGACTGGGLIAAAARLPRAMKSVRFLLLISMLAPQAHRRAFCQKAPIENVIVALFVGKESPA